MVPSDKESGPLNSLNIESVYRYGYACSATKAAFIEIDKEIYFGLGLNNVEVYK